MTGERESKRKACFLLLTGERDGNNDTGSIIEHVLA